MQRVVVNDSMSRWSLMSGDGDVPQQSVLQAMLFSICFNDTDSKMKHMLHCLH